MCCCFRPDAFPPQGEVVITIDELEALRLADVEGLYQEEGALSMGVSRPTFARMLRAARRKVAEALIMGKILHVEGGEVVPAENSRVNREREC